MFAFLIIIKYSISIFYILKLILDRIYKGINEKVSSGTTLQKTLFKFAFEYKKKWMERGFQTPLLDM